jgi:hypothetical protein
MFRRLVSVATMSLPILVQSSYQFRCFLDADAAVHQQKIAPPVIDNDKGEDKKEDKGDSEDETWTPLIIDDTEGDHEAWNIEKEKCSFCKQFLLSPCKLQFTRWSKCVDKAKETELNYVKVCSQYTEALMGCTSENQEYFMKLRDENGNETDEEDDGNDENVADPNPDENVADPNPSPKQESVENVNNASSA